MPLSPVNFFGNLDTSNPVGSDPGSILDDQARNNLQSMKNQGPNWTGAITATHTEVNRAQMGYGGLRSSGQQAISTITLAVGVRQKVTDFQATIDSSPVDVTQDLAGSTITLQPGRWFINGTVNGRGDQPQDQQKRIMQAQIVRTVPNTSTWMRAVSHVTNGDNVGFGMTVAGIYIVTVAEQLQLDIQAIGAASVAIDFWDCLELSAFRIGRI